MLRITLKTYTAMEIQMGAVPFLVDGWINNAIPSSPGVYVLLHDTDILYVGKAASTLRGRLHSYRRDQRFTSVWWQTVEKVWCTTLEKFYITDLYPSLNGTYHDSRAPMGWIDANTPYCWRCGGKCTEPVPTESSAARFRGIWGNPHL